MCPVALMKIVETWWYRDKSVMVKSPRAMNLSWKEGRSCDIGQDNNSLSEEDESPRERQAGRLVSLKGGRCFGLRGKGWCAVVCYNGGDREFVWRRYVLLFVGNRRFGREISLLCSGNWIVFDRETCLKWFVSSSRIIVAYIYIYRYSLKRWLGNE